MNKLFKKIKNLFAKHEGDAVTKSYIKYLTGELHYQQKITAEYMRDSARKDIEIRRLEWECQKLDSERVSTEERYFLKVCKHIYRNGKMISELRFRGMVAAFEGEGIHDNQIKLMGVNNGNFSSRKNK